MKEKVGFKQLDLNINTASIADLVNCINEISLLLSRQNISFDEIYDLIKNNEKIINIFEIIIENTKKRNLDLESIGLSENSISLFDIYNSIFNETTTQIDESVDNPYSILEDGYDSVKIYLQEIARYPILPKEEQRELLVEYYNTKDKKIKEKLTKHNLRLVTSIAKKFIGKGVPFLELIQEGNLGLMHAIDKFDPAKSYSLTTYAYWEIRQSVARYIQNTGRTIRVPVNIQDKMTEITKKRSELEIKLGRPASHSELARELGMSVEELDRIKNVTANTLSLEEKLSTNKTDSDKELKDIIGDDEPGPEEYAIINDEKKQVNDLLEYLTIKEREVIEYRFGINGKEKKSLKGLSIIFNCTRERIRQIELNALRKMKRKAESRIKTAKPIKEENKLSILRYLKHLRVSADELKEVLKQLEESDIELLNIYYNDELIEPKKINDSIVQEIIINKIIEEKIKPRIIEERQRRKDKIDLKKILELKLPKTIIPTSLFKFYQRYGYKKIQVEKTLKLLSQDEKILLDKIYEKDYQIIKNKNITEEEKELLKRIFLETIPNLIKQQNQNVYEYLELENIDKYKVNYAFFLLSTEEKEIIFKCFGQNFDYSNEELLKDKEIKTKVYDYILPKMKESILNYSVKNMVDLLKESVYDFFKDYNYSNEEIDKLLETLNDRTVLILNKYYKQQPEDKKKTKRQTIATIINALYKIQIDIIEQNQIKKEKSMQKNKKHYASTNNFYEYFESYGYTKEEIERLLKCISKKQLEKLHLYYGEDLENPTINKDIDQVDKAYVKSLLQITLKNKIKELKENDGIPKQKKKLSINNIYEYFKFHGYSEENIDTVLENVSQKQKELITLYYGNDLKNPTINENISEKDKTRIRNLISTTLLNRLDKYKETGIIKQKPKKTSNKTKENNKPRKKISIKNLYEYFIEYGFTENEITDVLNGLTEKQKKILKNFYGEDFKKTKEGKKSDKEEIQLRNLVAITIKSHLKKAKEKEVPIKKSKIDNIYEYFKSYGYSEKEVDYVIKNLNSNQFNKLYNFYGQNFHNPIINKNITKEELKYIRNLLTVTIKKKLKDEREYNKTIELKTNEKEEKHSKTIKKVFLAFCMGDNMTEKDLSQLDKNTLQYLIENDYLTLNNGIYEISKSKVNLLLDFYKGMLKEGQNEFASKIINKCYEIDPNNSVVNDLLFKEKGKKDTHDKQNVIQKVNFQDIAILFSNNDLEQVIPKVKNYLEENNKNEYYNLVLNLIRTSILEEDNNYTGPLMLLASVTNPNLNLLLAEIVQKFYKSLMDNDLELSEICLNTILNIDSLNEECLLKGNIEEIYKKKKVLKYDLKNNRLSEFETILNSIGNSNKNNNIFEEIEKNDTTVIEDKSTTLIELKNNLVKNPNIKVFMIGDERKKLVVRKFSEVQSQNEDEIYLNAQEDYKKHDFSEALKKLLSLRDDKYISNTNVYYMIGVCYVSLMNENNNYIEKAKEYISISNELSKYNDYDFLKNIELDFLITLIKKKLDSFNENEEKSLNEGIIDDKPLEKIQVDYNKLLGFILQKKNIDDELDKLDISETEKQIIKLNLCKYLYKSEYYDQGDKLLKEVEECETKTGKIDSIIKRITKRKKFYKYND